MRSSDQPERHRSLDAKIVGALDRTGEALGVLARRAAAAHDLSVTQMRVLVRLYAGPPPQALTSELARELDVSDPTVSDALAALRRKGLVERSADPADRRRQVLRLTASGHSVGVAVSRWTAPAGENRPFKQQVRASGGLAATVADAPTNRGQQLRFARRQTATSAPCR